MRHRRQGGGADTNIHAEYGNGSRQCYYTSLAETFYSAQMSKDEDSEASTVVVMSKRTPPLERRKLKWIRGAI